MTFEAPRSDMFHATHPLQLKAMGNVVRQRIMGVLTRESSTIGGLAKELGIARGSADYHLRVLRQAGLIEPAGRAVVKGGTEQRWLAKGREINLGAFADQPGAQATLLNAVAIELTEADHGSFEYTHVRRLKLKPADFESFQHALARLFADVRNASDAVSTDDRTIPVTFAATLFKNDPKVTAVNS